MTYRLWQLPSGSDMDNCLHDAVTIVMDERKRSTLIGYCQGELIVINQTNLKKKVKAAMNGNTFAKSSRILALQVFSSILN